MSTDTFFSEIHLSTRIKKKSFQKTHKNENYTQSGSLYYKQHDKYPYDNVEQLCEESQKHFMNKGCQIF